MSPSPGDALVCCVKKGRYQPARDNNWYRQTTTTLAFMITVVGQALIFWLPSCGCNSPQLEAHSAIFTPVTHNWFEGVRFHVLCLSFHHFRLSAILIGVQAKQGKQMLKSTLIATCLHQNSLIPDVPTGEAAVKRIFTDHYPGRDFKQWNTHLPDHIVERFLQASRNASTIRVDSFIRDLWNQ